MTQRFALAGLLFLASLTTASRIGLDPLARPLADRRGP